MKNIVKIYRGYSEYSEIIAILRGKYNEIANYTNDINFSGDYGKIILEYEFLEKSIIEEDINNRKLNVRDYDSLIKEKGINGYKWLISNKGVYHYRLRFNELRLKKIHYKGKDKLENLGLMFFLNRKYKGMTQQEFADLNNINRVKVSEYESGKKTPTIDRILQLGSYIKREQIMKINNILFSVK